MFNLANNSVKFTARGKIELSIFYDAKNNGLVFEINDTGIGLTPEQLKHLFKPFSQADSTTTRQYGGTGLGLYISRQLAHLLGGTIRVKSEFGKRQYFFRVRRSGRFGGCELADFGYALASLAGRVPRAGSKSPVQQFAGKVLVAEDNRDTQPFMDRMLKKSGLSAVVVGNGKAGIGEIKGGVFDLVMLDIQMPVMGGMKRPV